MSESAPLLEVRGIKKQYPGVLALKGVDFATLIGEILRCATDRIAAAA